MVCEVLRPFPGPGGRRFQAGEEVDVTEWMHTDRLIAQRYLRVRSLNKRKTEDSKASAEAEAKKKTVGTGKTKRSI